VGFALIVPKGGVPGSAAIRRVHRTLVHADDCGYDAAPSRKYRVIEVLERSGGHGRWFRHCRVVLRVLSPIEIEESISHVRNGRIVAGDHEQVPRSTIARASSTRSRDALRPDDWWARRQ
jgi:hypothetical protein